MLATAAGLATLAAAVLLAACSLRIQGRTAFLLALMTLAAAEIVGLSLFLSLFDAYRPAPMLIAQVVLLVAAGSWWALSGRPTPALGPLPSFAAARGAVTRHPAVAVIAGAALVACAVELLLALALAPNSWDSMMYHLSRAAMWIQNQSVLSLDGGTIYQTQHQANGEILYGWTLLLSDGDRLAALVQWTAAVGCGAVVFLGARMVDFSRSAAVFAAAVFVTFPQVVTQASSTWVDLPAAFFVGAFAVFCVRAIAGQRTGDLVIAALALGLALGTKGTAFIAAPALILIVGAALYHWRPPRRAVITGAVVLALGALALGSSRYFENVIDVGSPQGLAGDDVLRTSGLKTNLERTLWTFADIPGFAGSFPAEVLQRGTNHYFPGGADPAGTTYVSEDSVSFGIVGALLMLPLLAYFAFAPRVPPARRILALATGSYVATHAIVIEAFSYTPHTMVTGMLIGAPLLAWAAGVAWIRVLTVAAVIVVLVPVLIQNQKKPLWPTSSLGLSRSEQQSLQHPFEDNLARIDGVLPPDARIAFIGPRSATWDYPFFGPHYDRYVYRVEAYQDYNVPTQAEADEMIAARDLDAIVWSGVDPPPGTEVESLGNIANSRTVVQQTGESASP